MKPVLITIAVIIMHSVSAQNRPVKNMDRASAKNQQQENAVGAAVVKALQHKDIDAWIALHPTNDEYRDMLQAGLASKAEGLTQKKIDAMMLRRQNELAGAYTQQFNQFFKLADSLTIPWKEAVFQKFDFTVVYPEPVKLKYLVDGVIWFSCKHRHFVLDGIQAVEIGSGYKLQTITGIRQVDDGD